MRKHSAILVGILLLNTSTLACADTESASESDCPDRDDVICRHDGDLYRGYTFLPKSFETQLGEFREDLFYIPKSSGFSGGCRVSTPVFDVYGKGKLDATFTFKGAFADFIPDISAIGSMFAFQVQLEYYDDAGERHESVSLVKIEDLGPLKRVGMGDGQTGDFYFASSPNFTTTTLHGLEFGADARNISAKVCALFPEVDVSIKSIEVEAINR